MMAEPIGPASGLLNLATFAFQSSITLIKTVKSLKHPPSFVRDLRAELEDISAALRLLIETIGATTDIYLSTLNLPLLRCANACQDFEQAIKKYLSRSGSSRTTFREWAKLRYFEHGIDGFRQMLLRYKSTIIIAVTAANL
jgi:hypothetical protein